MQAVLAEDPQPELVTILAMGDQGVNRSDEDEHCALYLRNRLEGRNPDPEALRKLIMAGGATQKFFDDAQPQFHPRDVGLALEVDRYPFAMRVTREGWAAGSPVASADLPDTASGESAAKNRNRGAGLMAALFCCPERAVDSFIVARPHRCRRPETPKPAGAFLCAESSGCGSISVSIRFL